ncbi:MAG: nucleotidyl transferase AbiEii/AbiGii toxin family protein [Coriobacteriia bacterium]
MAAKTPNSRRNLDIAIERLFGEADDPLRVRKIIANTIVGQLLPKGAIKGGSALKLRYGDKVTRFTRDLDAARAEELETFIQELDAALAEGWNGFTGKVVRLQPAKPKNVPGEYIMQPFEIKMAYNGKSWLTVQLELGHDEIGDTDNPGYSISPDIVAVFEQLDLPAPKPVALMPIPHQIAQKLHAVSGENSERAHDLIDLQLILKNEDVDYPKTKEACRRLFNSRKLQEWPPVVVQGEGWDALYEGKLEDLDVLQSVNEAVGWVNALIEDIENSLGKG